MSLTDRQIAVAETKAALYRLYDQEGLYLEVHPTGSKLWRVKYYVNRKEKRLSLGKYPAVTLKDARLRTREIRAAALKGVDTGQ